MKTSAGESKQLIAWQEWRQFGSIMPACLFGMVLVAIHSYALGVMIEPLEREFGWSRSQISAGPLVTSIVTLLMAPVAGRALDRYGPRRIALIGIPAFSVALGLLSTAGPSLISWLALYVVLAFALLLIFPTVWTAAIAMRFDKNRGLAMSIALSGTGITSAIIPVLTAKLVEDFGWRGGYLGLAVLSFVIAYPLIYFLFDRDGDKYRPDHSAPRAASALPRATSEFRSPRFIRLALSALIYSVGATGLGINAVPILMEEGFVLVRAAEIAGLLGIGTITGRVLGGFLLDLIDGRIVATGCGMAAMLSAGVLLATDQSPAAAMAACFLLGLASGAEYDACAYLTTRYFPHRVFGSLFGVIGGLSAVGSGFSPLIANAIYDLTGTYEAVLWGIFPLFTIASILFLSLGKYPDKTELV